MCGFVLVAMCRVAIGGYYSDGPTIIESDMEEQCSSLQRNRMGTVERLLDKAFSSGYKAEYQARLREDCHALEQRKSIREAVLDACKQNARSLVKALDTLTLHGLGISKTDSGYVATVRGNFVGGHLDISCYADSRGNISRVVDNAAEFQRAIRQIRE